MNRTSPSWRIDATGMAILLALTVALGAAPAWILITDRQAVAAQTDALDVARQEHAAAMSALAVTRSRLARVQEELTNSSVQLEPPSAVNHRLADLSELATQCGLQVDQLKPADSLPGEHCRRIPIHMIARGTYRACVTFMDRLRRRLPDTAAGTIEMTGAPTEQDGNISLRCVLWWHATPDDSNDTAHVGPGRQPAFAIQT